VQKLLFIYIALIVLVRPAIPAFIYILNYDYISSVLCENKNKPEAHCNGKCFLEKNIEKDIQENHKNSSTPKSIATTEFVAIYTEQKNILSITYIENTQEKQHFPKKTENYSFNYSVNIFHPPALI